MKKLDKINSMPTNDKLNRRDFLKGIGVVAGTTLLKGPLGLVKEAEAETMGNLKEIGHLKDILTKKQIKELISLKNKGIDKLGLKLVAREFEKGEFTPENGYKLQYKQVTFPNVSDAIETVLFKKNERSYNIISYNVSRNTKKNNSTAQNNTTLDNQKKLLTNAEWLYLKKGGVNDKILERLKWLRSLNLALPSKYTCTQIHRVNETDEINYVQVNKIHWREEGFLPVVEIYDDKIIIYSEGDKKQVTITNMEEGMQLEFQSADNKYEEFLLVGERNLLEDRLREFFGK